MEDPEVIDFTLQLTPVTHPSLDLASFAGKKVLIFYFSPTCPHCLEAIPQIQSFADEIKADGYESIAVSIQRNTADEIKDFAAKYNFRWPIFWDEDRRFGGTYYPRSLPTLFLVEPSGAYIRKDKYSKETTLDELRKVL